MREIREIHCSCGGIAVEVDTTDNEVSDYGGHRDSTINQCCVAAVECNSCGVRLTIEFEAAEWA